MKISKMISSLSMMTLALFLSNTTYANDSAEDNALNINKPMHQITVIPNGGGLEISNEDGSKTFNVSGQIALNHSGFGGAYNVDDLGRGHFTQESQIQTARLGVSGNAAQHWLYVLQFANRANQENDRNDDVYVRLANVQYHGWDWGWLIFGKTSPYFGLDAMNDAYNTYGTNFTMLADVFSPPQALALALHAYSNDYRWIGNIGIYHTGSVIRSGRSDVRGERGYQQESHLFAGRTGWRIMDNEDKRQLLFVTASAMLVDGNDQTANAVGVDGGVLGTLIPSKNPPVTSGPLSETARQGDTRVFDIGLVAAKGPFSIETEYAQSHTRFEDVTHSSATYYGVYLQGGWVLTGEQRKFNKKAGYIMGVEPHSSWGAWEVIARIDHIDLQSRAGPNDSKTGDKATTYTAGLVWYVNNHVRFALDATHLSLSGPFVVTKSGNGAVGQVNFFF